MHWIENFDNILSNYKHLTKWIEDEQDNLLKHDNPSVLYFKVSEHPVIRICKPQQVYTNFLNSLKKNPNILEKLNTKCIFLGIQIDLNEDYVMYQLIHNYIKGKCDKENFLVNFLNFFYKEIEVEFKYKINNLAFDSFVLFKNDELKIRFERSKENYYILTNMKDDIWSKKVNPKNRLHSQNLIEYVSACFQLLTNTKMSYNHIDTHFFNVIDLIPENAIEVVDNINGSYSLNSNFIKIFKNFWQIFNEDYKDHSHALKLLLNAKNIFNSHADQFLYLIYCLESLVGLGDKDSLAYKISLRTAKLTEKNEGKQIIIRENMKRFYKIRSEFVHEGNDDGIDSEKTTKLESYVIKSFRNKILINHFYKQFCLETIFEDNEKKLVKKVRPKDFKSKSVEAIIDFVNFHDHECLKNYNSIDLI